MIHNLTSRRERCDDETMYFNINSKVSGQYIDTFKEMELVYGSEKERSRLASLIIGNIDEYNVCSLEKSLLNMPEYGRVYLMRIFIYCVYEFIIIGEEDTCGDDDSSEDKPFYDPIGVMSRSPDLPRIKDSEIHIYFEKAMKCLNSDTEMNLVTHYTFMEPRSGYVYLSQSDYVHFCLKYFNVDIYFGWYASEIYMKNRFISLLDLELKLHDILVEEQLCSQRWIDDEKMCLDDEYR